MTAKKVINYWGKSADEDLKTAEILFNTKRQLPCLFFCHLSLEKILKAHYVAKNNEAAPLIHDLVKLSRQAGLKLTQTWEEDLREISRFNLRARYDDYKFTMYKKATEEFTRRYFERVKEIYQWLKDKL